MLAQRHWIPTSHYSSKCYFFLRFSILELCFFDKKKKKETDRWCPCSYFLSPKSNYHSRILVTKSSNSWVTSLPASSKCSRWKELLFLDQQQIDICLYLWSLMAEKSERSAPSTTFRRSSGFEHLQKQRQSLSSARLEQAQGPSKISIFISASVGKVWSDFIWKGKGIEGNGIKFCTIVHQ